MKKAIFFCAIGVILLITGCKRDYNGTVTFWTASNCGTNAISVTIDGQSAQINKYFANGAVCNSYGCANFSLKAGTYNYNATNGDSSWQGTVTITKGGCILQQLICPNEGTITFWTSSNCSPNPINVTIDSQTAQITQYFPNNTPVCNNLGCANFILNAGTYSYTATDGDSTWQGNVTVTRGGCTLQQLTCSSYTGNVTFWTPGNCSPNPIVVTMDSLTHKITQYFPSSTPTCGAQGCANFTVTPGSYTYNATNGDTTWTGSVTVTKGVCTLQPLYCATGNVTFWVDSNANNTLVTLDSTSANITTAFPTSTPTCGTTGCANFTLRPGTYSYTAVTSSNVGYTGTVTITTGNCSVVKLF